jgi:hypothetical protein
LKLLKVVAAIWRCWGEAGDVVAASAVTGTSAAAQTIATEPISRLA